MFKSEDSMQIEHPLYDYLDFTYCSYGTPQIESSTIRVPIHELWVLAGFPGYAEDTYYNECTIVFEGINSSKRTVSEYADHNRTTIRRTYIVEDGPFLSTTGESYPCLISGVFPSLNAWIEWEIQASNIIIVP